MPVARKYPLRIVPEREEPQSKSFQEEILDLLKTGEAFTGWDLAIRTGAWSIQGAIYSLRMKGWRINQEIERPSGRLRYFMTNPRQLPRGKAWSALYQRGYDRA